MVRRWFHLVDQCSTLDVMATGEMLRRRSSHEPVHYILGEKEFWSHSFKVDSSVLIPRPCSELLVEAALEEINNNDDDSRTIRVLEMGVGSGCVLASLLRSIKEDLASKQRRRETTSEKRSEASSSPRVFGVGTDISDAALYVIRTI